jgi:mannitol-specific phosphotransferase system IIBC component
LLMVAQGILGLVLVVAGLMPAETLHFVYGCLIALLFPALWVYTRGETDRRASLWWGLASLALMALAFRAIGTGT